MKWYIPAFLLFALVAGNAQQASAQVALADLLGLNQLILDDDQVAATVNGQPVDIGTLLQQFGTPTGGAAATPMAAAGNPCIPPIISIGGGGGINIFIINLFGGGGLPGLVNVGGSVVNNINITINITINGGGGSVTAPMMGGGGGMMAGGGAID